MTDIKEIEDRFAQLVDDIGSEIERGERDEFEESDFEEFRPYIGNWGTLLDAIDEDNDEGETELWNKIKFGLPACK